MAQGVETMGGMGGMGITGGTCTESTGGVGELSAVDTGLTAGHLLAVKNWFQRC